MFSEFLIDAMVVCSGILLVGWAREVCRPSPQGGGPGPAPDGVAIYTTDVFNVLGIAREGRPGSDGHPEGGRRALGPRHTIVSRGRQGSARSPWYAPGCPR